MKRALALAPEQAEARVAAYRGTKGVSREVVEFTRSTVRDALGAAPQPPTTCWISYSLCVVGMLAVDCERQGLPLDRSVVLDRARIDRFLSHGCSHMTSAGKASYRSRLDIVANALLHGQNDSAWPRALLRAGDTLKPWDDEQAARIALWTSGLRPAGRRDRLRAVLALTLGAGLRRRDLVEITGRHVTADDQGVRVTVPAITAPDGMSPFAVRMPGDSGRTVTVAAAWEQDVLLAADRAGDNLLVAPNRTELNPDTLSRVIERTNRTAPAGDEFAVRRARNTWLVRHMAAGTPLPLLMEQAGLGTVEHLGDLLPYVPKADPAAAAAFMRGV